jgi:hypothetical protein
MMNNGDVERLSAEKEFRDVLELAVLKYLSKNTKSGNVPDPWNQFSYEHMRSVFYKELREWEDGERACELLDVIVTAVFLHKTRMKMLEDKLCEEKPVII